MSGRGKGVRGRYTVLSYLFAQPQFVATDARNQCPWRASSRSVVVCMSLPAITRNSKLSCNSYTTIDAKWTHTTTTIAWRRYPSPTYPPTLAPSLLRFHCSYTVSCSVLSSSHLKPISSAFESESDAISWYHTLHRLLVAKCSYRAEPGQYLVTTGTLGDGLSLKQGFEKRMSEFSYFS